MAFTLLKSPPEWKSAPLASCALMILSVSSIRIGMNRSAMLIIMAISWTGTLKACIHLRDVSSPSVRLFGVVVNVSMLDPMIR